MIRLPLTAMFAMLCSAVPAHAQSERWQVATEINNALSPNSAYIEADRGEFPLWLGISNSNGRVEVVVQVKNPGCYCAEEADLERFVRLASGSNREGAEGVLHITRGRSASRPIRLRRVRLGQGDDQVYEYRARLDNRQLAALGAGSGYTVEIGRNTFQFSGRGSARAIERIRRARPARR